jgi:UDP-glucuronate 4-epimerase
LARGLVDQGHEVLGIDNLNRYYDVQLKLDRLRNLGVVTADTGGTDDAAADAKNGGLRFVRLDLTDQECVLALFSREKFDAVCHLAAQAGVRYSLSDPVAYTASNVHGFLSVLEAARKHPVNHLVYASSSSVYGLDRYVPFGETGAADHPVSLYAATKRSNELMAHSYSHLFRIPTTGLRFFTVYGPWGRPDMALFLFTKAMLSGCTIDLYNHGKMQRDYTYVDDVVDAVLRVVDRPPQGNAAWDGRQSSVSPAPARVYNVGNGSPASLGDLVTALEEELGTKARVRKVPMQPGDVANTWADCTALREEVGFEARIPIREGVRRFVEWYRQYHET